MKRNIIASLDIGTTKTCAIIAEKDKDNRLNILGIGTAKSEGMTKGTVANILTISESIKKAVTLAEEQANLKINAVNVGVAGIYINSMRYRNFVLINNPDSLITKADVEKLIEDVKVSRIPSDYFILHIIPEQYIVDGENVVDNPVGVMGKKLEATHHIVLAQKTSTENLKMAVERAGLKINKMILQPLASANAVLHPEEKELGVALIDIGGGTTDLAVYVNGTIKHTRVIGIAGSHVTNDIREAFNLITEQSERIKIEYGYATNKALVQDSEIPVRVSPVRQVTISLSILTEIIQLRMKELFIMIDNELKNANLKDKIKAGFVLTGGGSQLRGCTELAEEIFGKQTRIGIPLDLGGGMSRKVEDPKFSTAVGLLLNGIPSIPDFNAEKIEYSSQRISLKNVLQKIFDFFKEF
ncbi:MAG: cell division protein FtsA [Ignavibacteria bacterium]|jgi:cell division protein FtsA|nr:cell division protein FtsA [Ignavibacteria bacterium]MDH7527384.1 cell division protein FtsA [Ignavibacteria bacterium]NPV12082.1 cell division protein FtsA [Ignavibacteria bacterium]